LFTENGQDPEAVLGNAGENVLSIMTENFLPYTLVAIYVAVVLSAIMSTIDSLLVIASSAITRDLYQKVFNPDIPDKDLTKMSRIVTLLMAIIALGIALVIAVNSPDRTVFWMVIFGWSGIAASFCPVIILSLFWKGYSEAGAIASMIAGFLCVPFFKFVVTNMDGIGPYFEKLDVLAPSFLISMIAGWGFSKLYPRTEELEELEEG
jgi:sodium/proline symporter